MILNYELFFHPSELFLLSLKRLGMLKILLCHVADHPFDAGPNADVGSKAFKAGNFLSFCSIFDVDSENSSIIFLYKLIEVSVFGFEEE